MDETDRTGPDRLFVYGTLMKRWPNSYARRLHSESAYLGAARIPGRLYLIGYFPGLAAAERTTDRVFGELVQLRTPARTLRWLDSYEGCGEGDPEPRIYARVKIPVVLTPGKSLEAWTYYHMGACHSARRLHGGRFMKNSPLRPNAQAAVSRNA